LYTRCNWLCFQQSTSVGAQDRYKNLLR